MRSRQQHSAGRGREPTMAHVYPPFAMRVEVSYWALQVAQRNESLTQSAAGLEGLRTKVSSRPLIKSSAPRGSCRR